MIYLEISLCWHFYSIWLLVCQNIINFSQNFHLIFHITWHQHPLKYSTQLESEKSKTDQKSWAKPKLEQLHAMQYEMFKLKQLEGINLYLVQYWLPKLILTTQLSQVTNMHSLSSWLICFKLSHSIRRLDLIDEQKSANHEPAETFVIFLLQLMYMIDSFSNLRWDECCCACHSSVYVAIRNTKQ